MFNRIFTLKTRSIVNAKNQSELFKMIVDNNFEALVDYFKGECDMIHTKISFSYGPTLRKKIKEFRKVNQQNNYIQRRY